MHNRFVARLTQACLVVCLCAVLGAPARAFGLEPAAQSAPQTFNLADFGAVGDGVTDDGPALQAALDALVAAGGGTLLVPAGRFVIATPVMSNASGPNMTLEIRGVPSATVVPPPTAGGDQLSLGLDLQSEFAPKTGDQQIALLIQGFRNFHIQDICFIGSADAANDALFVLAISYVPNAVIRHCEFYGLLSQFGAIVQSYSGGLTIQQSKFLGSTGNSGAYVPVVQNMEWESITVEDTIFIDYGQRAELYGKTGYGAPLSWINIGHAAPPTPARPRREVVLRNLFLDEGGWQAITALPGRTQNPTVPIDLFYATGFWVNVSNFNTTGLHLTGIRQVLVEDSLFTWSHQADSAIHIYDAQDAILDRVRTEAAATRLRAEYLTQRLTVIDSTYTDLASDAAQTNVLTPATADDDPVLYVRAQFQSALGRAPDAAAHYYWSRKLLDCGADAPCLTSQRAALAVYLAEQPAANFLLSVRATDENGQPLAGVNVTLTGLHLAATPATTTGDDGSYSFGPLPTSGEYTVTAGKRHYTFVAPTTHTVLTPAGDQVVNFNARLNRHAIVGRLLDEHGHAIQGATLTLSGAQAATTTSDTDGNYTFASLPAGGNYTVTPALAHHTFAPASQNFEDLSADTHADFTAAVVSYRITGHIVESGVPLSGVEVALAGPDAQTSRVTTNADGSYLFTVPALGDYTVTPSKKGYVFDPAAATFEALASDQTADFAAKLKSILSFAATNYTVAEGGGSLTVTVARAGDTTTADSVIYEGHSDTAKLGSDFVAGIGLITFEPGETSKTFTLFITDDGFVEGPEHFTLTLTPFNGAPTGNAITTSVLIDDNDTTPSTINPIDDDEFFIRGHYRDFFSREPDAPGLKFWTDEIKKCGTDAQCREARRISVSAAFFLSIEFKETGYLVYRLYRATYGRVPARVGEFMLDSRMMGNGVVVGEPGWAELLAANKQAFLEEWTRRPEFEDRFAGLDDAQFLQTLFTNMNVTLTDARRAEMLAKLAAGTTRAELLAEVIDDEQFSRQELNRAFVLMQYFGYLRRNPSDPPDDDLAGYNYWLGKLTEFGGDYERAEMVKAFLSSTEYRGRFGN